jgi:hypothetical protein
MESVVICAAICGICGKKKTTHLSQNFLSRAKPQSRKEMQVAGVLDTSTSSAQVSRLVQ